MICFRRGWPLRAYRNRLNAHPSGYSIEQHCPVSELTKTRTGSGDRVFGKLASCAVLFYASYKVEHSVNSLVAAPHLKIIRLLHRLENKNTP